jgi:hypothetical protein
VRSSQAPLALLALTACSFHPGGGKGGSGSPDDAGIDGGDEPGVDAARFDADPDDPCGEWIPVAPFEPCSIAQADRGSFLSLAASGVYRYDTDTGILTDPDDEPLDLQPFSELIDGGAARLMSVGGLDIGSAAHLFVSGEVPLIVASWGPIEVDGELDLSSGRGLGVGAGGSAMACEGTQQGANALGAGGGSYGGSGGAGGNGDAPPSAVVDGDPGLRGGCGGGNGGQGGVGTSSGGAGGGVVVLSSRFTISIDGVVHAGGGGGGGGPDGGGGGGGGSGGLVWLDSVVGTLVSSVGVVTANGGGGGEGSALGTGEPGQPAPITGAAAQGGKGGGANDGGDGGNGSGADIVDAQPGDDGNLSGGGGGGGGAGVIRVDGDLETPGDALLSPPASFFSP